VYLATECSNKSHSAAFPESLPSWFIKLFTQEGDVVLDPFSGSGTTMKVSKDLNRIGVGIEILEENCIVSSMRIGLFKSKRNKFTTFEGRND